MYDRRQREFWEDLQNSLKQVPTSMQQLIKHGKMGKNLIKISTARWPTRVLRTFLKIAKGGGYRVFVMNLTVSKG